MLKAETRAFHHNTDEVSQPPSPPPPQKKKIKTERNSHSNCDFFSHLFFRQRSTKPLPPDFSPQMSCSHILTYKYEKLNRSAAPRSCLRTELSAAEYVIETWEGGGAGEVVILTCRLRVRRRGGEVKVPSAEPPVPPSTSSPWCSGPTTCWRPRGGAPPDSPARGSAAGKHRQEL